jgi:hypothetical protein
MNRPAAAVAVALLVAPLAVRAADEKSAAAIELSHLAFSVATYQELLEKMTSEVERQLQDLAAQNGARIAPEFRAALLREYQQMLPYADLVEIQTGLFVKHYDEKELRELLAFYRTPVGQKSIRIMPEMMRDVMAKMQGVMQQKMPAAMERLTPLIQKTDAEPQKPTEPQKSPEPQKAPAKKPSR